MATIMPLDDPRFDVLTFGAAHVLGKPPEAVTEEERARFRAAHLNAFAVTHPVVHAKMDLLRGGPYASEVQSDGEGWLLTA